ncbi:MAG: serine hydrolase domain-containing protein [Ignavibacteriaceae bacterium]
MLYNRTNSGKPVLFFILFFFISYIVQAQNFSKIDNWLEDNVSDMGGRAVLMIYKDGKIVYSNTVNDMSGKQKRAAKFMAKRKNKEPNTADFSTSSRQPVASCSKWLSAALVMTFVDEGKLKLTDTIGTFLPVLTKHGKGNITISQCLSHTTGIKGIPAKESINELKGVNSMDEAINKFAMYPMEGKPGTIFHYSNIGMQIAGAVIEKIGGKSFETLFAERIALPLEMKNTDFGKMKVPLPAGGAVTTPGDYMNFLVMILNKGIYKGKRILSENSIAEMQVNRITTDTKISYSPADGGNAGYGYGEWIMETSPNSKFAKTVSSPGLLGSFPWVDNEKEYSAFLMTYYIKSEGRSQRYKELKSLVDNIMN